MIEGARIVCFSVGDEKNMPQMQFFQKLHLENPRWKEVRLWNPYTYLLVFSFFKCVIMVSLENFAPSMCYIYDDIINRISYNKSPSSPPPPPHTFFSQNLFPGSSPKENLRAPLRKAGAIWNFLKHDRWMMDTWTSIYIFRLRGRDHTRGEGEEG